jgi:hypothetical protein
VRCGCADVVFIHVLSNGVGSKGNLSGSILR